MNQVVTYNSAADAVQSWKGEITSVLSPDMDQDKFITAVITALNMNPDIGKKCTTDSIKNACIKAAYDGLRPDGKEGAIVAYGNQAQWMPMIYGIRKKAREHDGILIKAEVIHENDRFHYSTGDEERLEHEPCPLTEEPGKVIGAYAIFRRENTGEVLHRELLRKSDLDQIRKSSKSPNSPAWTRFENQMHKKCAARRGVNSVPLSDRVMTIIRRDDDLYDFDRTSTPDRPSGVERLAAARQAQTEDENQDKQEGFSLSYVHETTATAVDQQAEDIPANDEPQNEETPADDAPLQQEDTQQAGGDRNVLAEVADELDRCETPDEVNEVVGRFQELLNALPENDKATARLKVKEAKARVKGGEA